MAKKLKRDTPRADMEQAASIKELAIYVEQVTAIIEPLKRTQRNWVLFACLQLNGAKLVVG